MDAESKAEVLDALAQRYEAVKDSSGSGSGKSDPAAAGKGGQTGGGTQVRRHRGSADPGSGDPALASDPLLNGLASDPLMGGLGALAGPAMGALSGLPGAMGSDHARPGGGLGGGGGRPLGDLGGAIGGAIKEATAHPDDPAAKVDDYPLAKGKDGSESSSASDEHLDDADSAAKGDKAIRQGHGCSQAWRR